MCLVHAALKNVNIKLELIQVAVGTIGAPKGGEWGLPGCSPPTQSEI